MAIKIEMLRCFCTVAQSGTLAEAAARLGRTQSAISMTLKQFEAHLGERLFETERKNRLTPVGAQVFELALKQLRQFESTVQAIETSARSPQGLIRIASIPSVAGLVFAPVSDVMTRRHPDLKLELRDADTAQVLDALVQGQADIGIGSGRHSLNNMRRTLLFRDRFGLISARDHPLAMQAAPPTINDVTANGFMRNNLCATIRTPEFQAAIATAPVTVHNTLSLVTMMRSRNWVTVLPQSVVQIMPRDLVFRPIEDLPEHRAVYLYVRERGPFAELVSAFETLISEFDWTVAMGAQD